MDDLNGRVALVTGASRGIGAAVARALHEAGAKLGLASRGGDDLGLAEVVARPADVRDPAAMERIVAATVEAFGRLDILVVNAGVGSYGPFLDLPAEQMEEMIDTNVKGLLYVTRAFLPHMIERGRGHVVNLGSVAGHQVYPKGNVYTATKHAVRALTHALALDLAGTPIRVSSIDPGLVETEFSIVRFKGDRERAASVYRGLQPLTGDDVADAVLYAVNAPPHVNVLELLLLPTAQRSATVVHRE